MSKRLMTVAEKKLTGLSGGQTPAKNIITLTLTLKTKKKDYHNMFLHLQDISQNFQFRL